MEDELEKKQTFLRANILEKGYDAEEFMNFLQTKKGEFGLDLNNWNISELKIAVQEFISSLEKDNLLLNPQNINKEEEVDKNLNNDNNNNLENLFTKSYVTYLMQTTPLDFKLRKRYSDFEWLRNILSLIYINCIIPPLCKKNYTDRFSEVLIAKRTRSIEKFMKGILIHPLIRNDEIFYNFISTESEAEFEKKKKIYNKIQSPFKI